MPQPEGKHDKTKKKPPKSPTKKETLLEASCIAKKSFYDNPIMSEKAQQKAPEASVQQEFHLMSYGPRRNSGYYRQWLFSVVLLSVGLVALFIFCLALCGWKNANVIEVLEMP